MEKYKILLALIGFFFTTHVFAQTPFENSTFKLESKLTDEILNQCDTLVQVTLVVMLDNVNELSKIHVNGGSKLKFSDIYQKVFNVFDQQLIDNKILIKESNQIKIILGNFDFTKGPIHFEVKLEDMKSILSEPIKEIH